MKTLNSNAGHAVLLVLLVFSSRYELVVELPLVAEPIPVVIVFRYNAAVLYLLMMVVA